MKLKLTPGHFLNTKLVLVTLSIIAIIGGSVAGWEFYLLQHQNSDVAALQKASQHNLEDASYSAMQLTTIKSQNEALEKQFELAKSDADHVRFATIDALYLQFEDIATKVSRNGLVKLDTAAVTNLYGSWGSQLLLKQYEPLKTAMSASAVSLDDQYKSYQTSLVKATPKPTATKAPPTGGGGGGSAVGYSATSVSTARGTFSVKLVKLPLSEVTVKTVTANSDNCANDCPTKSLSQYVSENGAYAGINGTYFCPPDYASCAGKKNSYDFAVYNTNLGKWLNPAALGWNSEGLATFSGHSATFYRYANQFDGHAVTAGIANFPPLLVQGGVVVITDNDLDAAQKNKGLRGALGVDGSNIYLAIVSGASITDAAYTMRALGATEVLNLDGGGSSALYIGGSYKAGPGRSLPNAVVLMK